MADQQEDGRIYTDLEFEDIEPWGSVGGDTGLSARLKLKRNFEKIKAWADSHGIMSISFLSRFFLSKIDDDEAQGLIGFLKGAWFGAKEWIIDALGNANFNNTTVNGILRALNAYINKAQSTNYTGDGMLDTGWRITNDYEGSNSKATFDYLYIRKKALFEELEIRKLSHIGGNFCLSPASGKAWCVEAYDANGNLLGYDTYSIPWTLGGRILNLFSHNLANRYLGRTKCFSRKMTDEEKRAMRRIRVFLFSDDGTTQTMQNWTVGAQARCQSFNITKQMDYHGSGEDSDNPDVQYWTGKKVQNTYWWRLVAGVGTGIPQSSIDNAEHAYIDFLVNLPTTSEEYTNADIGSDIPSAGDEFCQFGHRTRSDLSNVIMIETANEDSPALKFYHGINSWNLNGKRPVIISPTLVEMKASMFRWITEYGDPTGQITKRGLWINIEPDQNGNRRCYANDVVSHNGTMWRCIVASGSHKEDDNGRWYTQAEIDAMTLEEQMALHDVENYTILEPSAQASDWTEYTDDAIAPYVKFSEGLIAVPCEKDRKASEAVSKTITAKLMVTNLEATITSIAVEGADSFVSVSGNNIVVSVPKGSTVANKDYIVTIEGDCLNNHYIATDKISLFAAVRGNDAYEIHTTPAHWIWNQDGANMSPEDIIAALEDGTELTFNIQIDGVETLPDGSMGNSCAQISVVNDGDNMPFTINSVATSDNRIGTSYNNQTGHVWVTSLPNTIESGWVDVTITYGDNATQTIRIPFYCNLLGTWREQIIGDTRVAIADKTRYLDTLYTDFHAEYAQSSQENTVKFQKITTDISNLEDADVTLQNNIDTATTTLNNSISTAQTTLQNNINATNTALNQAKTDLSGDINTVSTSLATYQQTADAEIAALTTRVSNNETSITNQNTRISTAEGNINTISSEIETVDGKFASYYTKTETSTLVSQSISAATDGMVTTSNFKQTADGFSLITSTTAQNMANTAESNAKNYADNEVDDLEEEVYGNLSQVGIDIDGANKSITLYGDKVSFVTSSGDAANISFNTEHNTFKIGGFYIDNGSIRTNWDVSGTKGAIYISSSTGEIYCTGDSTVGGTLTAKDLSVTRTTELKNLSVSNTATFNGATTFKGEVAINRGNALHANGDCHFGGALKTASFTLPTSPSHGQTIFFKGMGADITISTQGHAIISDSDNSVWVAKNSSGDFKKWSGILMFDAYHSVTGSDGGCWVWFKCHD